MKDYYAARLSSLKLKQAYDVAQPRARRYLAAEVDHVVQRIKPGHRVLELGCGYGRVLEPLAKAAGGVFGIDTAPASLEMAVGELAGLDVKLAAMDAAALAFADSRFDLTVCIQNGISAFKRSGETLFREAVRVTRPGGRVLFSSYADQFWPHRLEWFRLQSQAGLLGELDEEASGDGVVVCKDGFKSSTVGSDEMVDLARAVGLDPQIEIVDESSVFCEMIVP